VLLSRTSQAESAAFVMLVLAAIVLALWRGQSGFLQVIRIEFLAIAPNQDFYRIHDRRGCGLRRALLVEQQCQRLVDAVDGGFNVEGGVWHHWEGRQPQSSKWYVSGSSTTLNKPSTVCVG